MNWLQPEGGGGDDPEDFGGVIYEDKCCWDTCRLEIEWTENNGKQDAENGDSRKISAHTYIHTSRNRS